MDPLMFETRICNLLKNCIETARSTLCSKYERALSSEALEDREKLIGFLIHVLYLIKYICPEQYSIPDLNWSIETLRKTDISSMDALQLETVFARIVKVS